MLNKNIMFKKTYAFGILLFLSSCVSLPKEEQQENILSAPSLNPSVKESLESGYFSAGDWPQENWWEIFQSSELDELIHEALSHNPTIQSIQSRVEFAKQTSKVVRSRLFPPPLFRCR